MNPLGLTEAHLIDRDGVHKRARLPLSGYGHTNDNTPHPFPNCAVKLIRPDKSTVVGDHTGTSGAVTFLFSPFLFFFCSMLSWLCSRDNQLWPRSGPNLFSLLLNSDPDSGALHGMLWPGVTVTSYQMYAYSRLRCPHFGQHSQVWLLRWSTSKMRPVQWKFITLTSHTS